MPKVDLPRRADRPWLGARTRSSLRRSLVLLVLAPLGILLATRLAHLLDDPVLGVYGVAVLTVGATVFYLALAEYRDPADDPPLTSELPLVSCLVAVKNEPEMISRCVRSLLASDYPALEVIVVDDGSTDETGAQLRELREATPFTLITLSHSVGKKKALMAGAYGAQGEIFVFTDSDCVVAPDAVQKVVRAFQADPSIGAVSGHARAYNADATLLTKVQDTWYEGQFSIWKAAEAVFGAVSCISGPLAAFRRDVVYGLLPAWANDTFLGREFRFATDRQLTAYVLGSEHLPEKLRHEHANSPFARRSRAAAVRTWRVGYVKSAKVWTVVPHTFDRFLRQQVRWKKSFIRNLFFTGRFYWRRGAVPAFLFYGHVLFVLAAPLMAFRHLVYLPAQGELRLTALYLGGVLLKGGFWAAAYKIQNPGCARWPYRPLMSAISALLSSVLLLYAAATLRRSVWARG